MEHDGEHVSDPRAVVILVAKHPSSRNLHIQLARDGELIVFNPLLSKVPDSPGLETLYIPPDGMVLLSSTTVGVVVSSSIVCLCTLALFLAGYVVQQHSVQALQLAIKPPPPPDYGLPVYYPGYEPNTTETEEILALQSEIAIVAGLDDEAGKQKTTTPAAPQEVERIAYVQAVADPAELCSALLFFRTQASAGRASIARILIYPYYWQEKKQEYPVFAAALDLMNKTSSETGTNIIPKPVHIDQDVGAWEAEKQLLAIMSSSVLQKSYDRLLYLRSPGLALDIPSLDAALNASLSSTSLAGGWASQDLDVRHGLAALLFTSEGAFSTRGANRRLTSEALTSHANGHQAGSDSVDAAYVHFDEGELEHRRKENEWSGGLFARYEKAQREVCGGVDLRWEMSEVDLMRRERRMRSWRMCQDCNGT